MSEELCFFCEENALDHTYECCKKQGCKECNQKMRSECCPWCRQIPPNDAFVNNNLLSSNNNLLSFDDWLNDNNIVRTEYVNRCIDHINTIKECFANKQTDTIEFQVANVNKIHVFKYNNIEEISFTYWERWGSIEVSGGQYYRRDIPHDSNHFGWWLHGFVKQL